MVDDTPSTCEIRPDGGSEYEDVNEAVEVEWIDDTTPFERVYAIIRSTYEPTPAGEIADRARVSPPTARKHLRALENTSEVTTSQEGQTTHYHRSETAFITENAQSILAERTHEEIVAGIAKMKSQMQEWREEHGVDSPEEFAREFDIEDADSNHDAILQEWQTTQRNLALAEAALAIGEAIETTPITTDTTDA